VVSAGPAARGGNEAPARQGGRHVLRARVFDTTRVRGARYTPGCIVADYGHQSAQRARTHATYHDHPRPTMPLYRYFPALIPSLRGPPPVSPQYVFLRRCYAIAMLTEGSKVWNGLVTPSNTTEGTTLYKLFVKQKFNSLPELIDFYCEHPVTTDSKGNKLKLKKPVA